jgi:hypothetical protein
MKMAFEVLMPKKRQQKSTCQKTPPTKGGPPNPSLGGSTAAAGVQPRVKGGTRNLPSASLGACFKRGKEGHWACQCPNPRPPTKPCPKCKQVGHWGSDCPGQGLPPMAPRGGSAPLAIQIPDFLGLAED